MFLPVNMFLLLLLLFRSISTNPFIFLHRIIIVIIIPIVTIVRNVEIPTQIHSSNEESSVKVAMKFIYLLPNYNKVHFLIEYEDVHNFKLEEKTD